MKENISLLFCSTNNISSRFTLYPFWISENRTKFNFFDDENKLVRYDKNSTLVVFSKFFRTLENEKRIHFLERIRARYSKLVFFEDNAGSESEYLGFLPYFDLYFKKQVFKDRSLYTKELYGNKIFTDYYFNKFGVEMIPYPVAPKRPELGELNKKLRIGWNLAIGQYFNHSRWNRPDYFPIMYKLFGPLVLSRIFGRFPNLKACPSPKHVVCQARFNYEPKRSGIDYQRKLFLEIVSNNPLFVSGKIAKPEYNLELRNVKAVLSPFGFGEICFRDFEAIINGSVLIKPDMAHIETWPDIYKPDRTYVPILWDGSDLLTKVEGVLEDDGFIEQLRNTAWEELKISYQSIEERVRYFVKEIEDL
ncbi:hypothetical protein [Mariniradius sediminis]|uniref:Glycosyltransferase family 1 protein n=1 Tax=Mariniradius sediminis TaxID=2909237 RepID=A0ABS9BPZ9_9BACT|nr:hypothetical protein [Mariniradius sediminis]MCF1750131.1 hypothetical protein [Mariniradius sediminis]